MNQAMANMRVLERSRGGVMQDAVALEASVQFDGLPPSAAQEIQAMWRDEEDIRAQMYRPEKQDELIFQRRELAASRLAEQITATERDATAERDRDLAEATKAIARATELPAKNILEGDTEYVAPLARVQIHEQRTTQALIKAQMDLALLVSMEDVEDITRVLDETFSTGNADAIGRVGRAVEARLRAAAVEEQARGIAGGPAFIAHTTTQERLRTWRATESAKSPAVQRQKIHERYAQRVQEARRAIGQAAQKFGLGPLMGRAL